MPVPNKVRIITSGPSNGASALAQMLIQDYGVNTTKTRSTSGPKTANRLNVKWGCFQLHTTDFAGIYLNSAASDVSLNKLTCFQRLAEHNVPIPAFTSSLQEATHWITNGCRRVYQRNLLRASEGDGIVVVDLDAQGNYTTPDRLTNAPLYTKGLFGIRREYRIHVFRSEGVKRVFIQQKKRRTTGVEETTSENRVRNLANGWIFAHNDITAPRQQTIDIAVHAVNALNLNFGAIDLIEMEDASLGSFVLEVNCAPGLQGATLDFYAEAINDLIDGVVDAERADDDDDDDIDPFDDDEF